MTELKGKLVVLKELNVDFFMTCMLSASPKAVLGWVDMMFAARLAYSPQTVMVLLPTCSCLV